MPRNPTSREGVQIQPGRANRPIELAVRQPYFGMIANGTKTIEGRLDYSSLNRAAENGIINFRRHQKEKEKDDRVIRCSIDWVLRAADFETALIEVEWRKAVPDADHFDKALALYDRIYPARRVQEIGGVVLIGFTKLAAINA